MTGIKNDRGREDTFSPVRTKAVGGPDALWLCQQHF